MFFWFGFGLGVLGLGFAVDGLMGNLRALPPSVLELSLAEKRLCRVQQRQPVGNVTHKTDPIKKIQINEYYTNCLKLLQNITQQKNHTASSSARHNNPQLNFDPQNNPLLNIKNNPLSNFDP